MELKRSKLVRLACCAIAIAGCTSAGDQTFPSLTLEAPVTLIANRVMGPDGPRGRSEVCQVNDQEKVDDISDYLRSRFRGGWLRNWFHHYAPRYHVLSGQSELLVLHGGVEIVLPATGHWITSGSRVRFHRSASPEDTSELLNYICPGADFPPI